MTPLYSTIILLVVTIVIGAGVMQWNEQNLQDQSNTRAQVATDHCAPIRLAPFLLNDAPEACASLNTVQVFVENTGQSAVTSLAIQAIGTHDVANAHLPLSIDPETTRGMSIPYDAPLLGAIRQVRVTPYLDTTACKEKTLILQPIPACT